MTQTPDPAPETAETTMAPVSPIDAALQAAIDDENAALAVATQQATMNYLQQRIVALLRENQDLKQRLAGDGD